MSAEQAARARRWLEGWLRYGPEDAVQCLAEDLSGIVMIREGVAALLAEHQRERERLERTAANALAAYDGAVIEGRKEAAQLLRELGEARARVATLLAAEAARDTALAAVESLAREQERMIAAWNRDLAEVEKLQAEVASLTTPVADCHGAGHRWLKGCDTCRSGRTPPRVDLTAEVEKLTRERDNWQNEAAGFMKGSDFYRDLVRQIGAPFGAPAFTSDDGSVQTDVLALKVPGLVAALRTELSQQAERLGEADRLLRICHGCEPGHCVGAPICQVGAFLAAAPPPRVAEGPTTIRNEGAAANAAITVSTHGSGAEGAIPPPPPSDSTGLGKVAPDAPTLSSADAFTSSAPAPLPRNPAPQGFAIPTPQEAVTPEPLKYRKRPVVVEAFQMTEARRNDNAEWPHWLNEAWNGEMGKPGSFWCDYPGHERLVIGTLEGAHVVTYGDFIVRGIKGELYPVKPDIFEATYEPVSGAKAPEEK